MSAEKRDRGGSDDARIASALQILGQEIAVLESLREKIGPDFAEASRRIQETRGRVVTTGMGKAGIIATKVSATLASTGTPSNFLHPAEAIHGDLGRIVEGDLLLAFSKSGETEELLRLIPAVKAAHIEIFAITQSCESSLGKHADLVLELGAIDEAGPHGLAPTASTIAMLAIGDALAMVVQERRDFGPRDFARFHPGGSLGRRLMYVDEVMRDGERLPLIQSGATVREAIVKMTNTAGRPGAVIIADSEQRLRGFFTDGDLRRHLDEGSENLLAKSIDSVMTANPKCVRTKDLAAEALALMRDFHIDQLPVLAQDSDRIAGLIDIQDLVELKF